LSASRTPAATPRYAAAGIVVIEMATPTVELARVSSDRIPAMPAANATRMVEVLTVVRPDSADSPTAKFRAGDAGGRRSC